MASGGTSGQLGSTNSTVLSELDQTDSNRSGAVPVARGDMKSVVEGSLRYILNGDGAEELYDVAVDPDERINLATRPDMASALAKIRSALVAETSAGRSLLGMPRGGR
jgi:hypothetical protein